MPSFLSMLSGQWALIGRILFIGTLSGFPQVLTGSLLSLWLKEAGISKTAIGAFGIVSVFYTFNWVFAPLLDRYHGLGLDRRRFWLLVTQAMMLLACLGLAFINIFAQLWLLGGLVLVIAFASSLQDVAIDALRIEMTPENRRDLLALGSACAVIGWYTGFNLGGALGLHMFAAMDAVSVASGVQIWREVYLWLAGLLAVLMVLTQVLLPRGLTQPLPEVLQSRQDWLTQVFVQPFAAFIRDKGWKLSVMLLTFVFLFKIGEAFLGRMAMLFYKEVGFTEQEIADYAKIVGWVVIAVFSVVGGFLAGRFGVWRGLMIGGVAMASTNLLFALLAVVGASVPLLVVAVVADQFTTAFSTVSFVAFISAMCDRHYTASQYALLASVGNASRILLASSSGFVLEYWLDNSWSWFFILTSVMVIPSLILLYLMRAEVQMFEARN